MAERQPGSPASLPRSYSEIHRQIRSWARGRQFSRAGLERLMADLDGLPARNDERGTTNDDLQGQRAGRKALRLSIIHHSSFIIHHFSRILSSISAASCSLMRLRHCFWASGCSVQQPGKHSRQPWRCKSALRPAMKLAPEIIQQRHVCARTQSAILRVRPRRKSSPST